MKKLRQSLIDYQLAQLRAIADCRGVPLETVRQQEAAAQLAEALLSPAATAIALADLTEPEREALQTLLENGGQMERARFARQYGYIRPMGPARLVREQPWRSPINPAEGLWYRGLIFKAFQMGDENSSVEMVYIPVDLRPLLEIPASEPPESEPAPALAVAPIPAPDRLISGADRLRENLFRLLVYLQTTPVRLAEEGRLSQPQKTALTDCLLPPLWSGLSLEAELTFLLHLGRRAGLLVMAHSRLRPDPDPTRAWLQADPARQLRQLQETWQADPTWNDLWQTPGLAPQATGWENSPLLARSKILGYLGQAAKGTWLSIDDFVATIKRLDPDFQRPDGDYKSWYIQDERGNFLMGFEHWDRVEGALIRYLLTGLLPLLDVVELGFEEESDSPAGFCITPTGAAFLAGDPLSSPAPDQPAWLQVNAQFYVTVPAGASLYDRFQLARFAALDRREAKRTVYRISQASVGRAIRNGVTADQITAFLARATNNQTPLKVVETIRAWAARRGTVHLEQATILYVKEADQIEQLRQHPPLASLLGEQIGPTAILIPPEQVSRVRQLLQELGYIE